MKIYYNNLNATLKQLYFICVASIILFNSCADSTNNNSIIENNEEETIIEPYVIDRAEQAANIAETTIEYISPKDVSNDTNYVKLNTADLQVTLLLRNYFDTLGNFGPQQKKRTDIPKFDFSESLMWGTNVTAIENDLYFSGTVRITDTSAWVNDYNGYCNLDIDTIPTWQFETYEEGNEYKIDLGDLIVEHGGLSCMDTGTNRIRIENDKGSLDFGWMGNLKLFEHDLNSDGTKEMYVISYETCMQFVTIYKIEA